jgi:hypothetical protein
MSNYKQLEVWQRAHAIAARIDREAHQIEPPTTD